MTRVAAVDCGTNTIRLLIADLIRDGAGRAHLEPLRRRNEIVRLGQGVDRTGMLDPAALERTLAVVKDYAADCADLGVEPGEGNRRFVATSATRDARNREDFVAGVRRLLGIEPEVVSGQEEARLSFSGSLLGVRGGEDAGVQKGGERVQAPRLVVDLGETARLTPDAQLGNLEHPPPSLSLDDDLISSHAHNVLLPHCHCVGTSTPARLSCISTPAEISRCPAGITALIEPSGSPQIS